MQKLHKIQTMHKILNFISNDKDVNQLLQWHMERDGNLNNNKRKTSSCFDSQITMHLAAKSETFQMLSQGSSNHVHVMNDQRQTQYSWSMVEGWATESSLHTCCSHVSAEPDTSHLATLYQHRFLYSRKIILWLLLPPVPNNKTHNQCFIQFKLSFY